MRLVSVLSAVPLGLTVPQDSSGWKGPQEISSPTSCSSRVSCEVRPGCSGIYPVKSWKPPGMEMPQPPCASCGTDCPCGEKVFPYIHFEYLVSIYACCSSTSCHTPPQGAWLHLFYALPIGTGELLLGLPAKLPFLQAEQAPVLQPHLTGQVLQPLTILVLLCWTPFNGQTPFLHR